MAVDVTNREALTEWLEKQPRDLVTGIAARSALRVFPIINRFYITEKTADEILLPLLRAVALPWMAALFPVRSRILPSVAGAVASRAVHAARAAAHVVGYAAADAVADAAADTIVRAARAVGAADYAVADAAAYAAARAAFCILATRILTQYDVDHNGALQSPLWQMESGNHIPAEILHHWSTLKSNLLALHPNWHVWTDWYEARLWPDKFPAPIEKLEIARALIPEKIWEGGWEVVNPYIEGLIAEHTSKTDLATLARSTSPQPHIENGQLNVRANPEYDVPDVDDDLIELPIRQRSIIKSLLAELTGNKNTPPSVVMSLEEYGTELAARGVQPFLGVLRDHAGILKGGVLASDHDFEWCSGAAKAAFERFFANNELIIEHFPLDLQREQEYANISVDENALYGDGLLNPVSDFLVAVSINHRDGELTSEDYFTAVQKMEELAKVLSTAPPLKNASAGELSAIKRFYGKFVGFVKSTADLLKSMDSIAGSETAMRLWESAQAILEVLLKFLN